MERTNPTLPTDVYLYLLNFADDRTALQMLSVNKKFSDDIFFERILDRKYPYLKQFKKEDETWRRFFVRMTYYIDKLDKEYGIPYIPTKYYDPEKFYNEWGKDSKYIYNYAMFAAAYGGYLDIVNLMIDKGAADFNMAMCLAAGKGYLDIVKCLIEKGATWFNGAMYYAADEGHTEIVEYLEQFV